jgi:catechol 2,3-dioxygenase-like lactoylglutathione lyase family enzyme
MIHHVTFGTNDVERAQRFYDPLMELVGLRRLKLNEGGVHYGTGEILFSLVTTVNGKPATAGNGAHVAFQARDRAMVKKFYELALKNGGRSDGEPGLRPDYDVNYYGGFVFDPDGNKIEAVTLSGSSMED